MTLKYCWLRFSFPRGGNIKKEFVNVSFLLYFFCVFKYFICLTAKGQMGEVG